MRLIKNCVVGRFLADVLGLRDISYKARNAIIVDYFSGFLLYVVNLVFHTLQIIMFLHGRVGFNMQSIKKRQKTIKSRIMCSFLDSPPVSTPVVGCILTRVTVVCRFSKEAGLSLKVTFHVWKMSHDMLDFILGKVAIGHILISLACSLYVAV